MTKEAPAHFLVEKPVTIAQNHPMSLLDSLPRRFFWRPSGSTPALEFLDARHGVLARRDVTVLVGAHDQGRHRLMVVELAGGKVVGDLRLAATRDDVVIGGVQTIFGCDDPDRHYALKRRRFRIPKYRRGTALLLGAANGDNYYHWLLDSLPRWKLLQAANFPDYDFVLLQGRSSRFQDETLDRLNIPAAKRLRCSKNFVHQFERLVVPAMPFPVQEVPDWACAWVRSLFPERASGPEKIYLSRRGAARRRFVNEPELQKALEERGFVSVQPETLTVAEQAKLLSSVRCVVAPHGAALANLVFAPPGTVLLELFDPQYRHRNYANLAAACGHHYLSLDGQATNDAGEQRLEYAVDISAVVGTIAKNI